MKGGFLLGTVRIDPRDSPKCEFQQTASPFFFLLCTRVKSNRYIQRTCQKCRLGGNYESITQTFQFLYAFYVTANNVVIN